MEYRLYPGDCLEVMPTLPPQSIDAIICDPPYGTTACAWDIVIPFAPMWECIKRVIKPRGAVVLFGSQPYAAALVMSNPEWFKYDWVWLKGKPSGFLNAKIRPLSVHESILVFNTNTYTPIMQELTESGKARNNRTNNIETFTEKDSTYGKVAAVLKYLGKTVGYPKSAIFFDKEANNQFQKQVFHPAQKPVDLLSYLIRTYTAPGETVLDFTMGSGSTGVACAETGRSFVGIELYPLPHLPISTENPDYFAIATDRIEAAYRRASGLPKLGKATDTADLPLFA